MRRTPSRLADFRLWNRVANLVRDRVHQMLIIRHVDLQFSSRG